MLAGLGDKRRFRKMFWRPNQWNLGRRIFSPGGLVFFLFPRLSSSYKMLFPQCPPRASRKPSLCPAPLSPNSLTRLLVTKQTLFGSLPISFIHSCSFSYAPGKGLRHAALVISCMLACPESSQKVAVWRWYHWRWWVSWLYSAHPDSSHGWLLQIIAIMLQRPSATNFHHHIPFL